MKKAEHAKYYFIPEDETKLYNNGFCVLDNFLGTYEPLIKKLNRQKFIELCNEVSLLNDKNVHEGVTSEQLLYFCQHYDIAMYAYNIANYCFLKNISKNRGYPELVYYCVNNHMYHISDKLACKSLVEKAKEIKTIVNSDIFDKEFEKFNIFEEKLEIIENMDIKDVFKLTEPKIIMYLYSSLNQQLIQLVYGN